MTSSDDKKLKKYSDEISNGLDEYVHQDISGFANRYYDVGKFLFTVSTFAIVAMFTLRSTFGKDYNAVFISIIFFLYCLYPSYKLTVGIDYEIKPLNTILEEYGLKKKWMKGYVRIWAISFVCGLTALVVSFGYAVYNPEKVEANKIEQSLQDAVKTLEGILQEIKKERAQPTQAVLPCGVVGAPELVSALSGFSDALSAHDAKVGASFVKVEVHEDRHLQKIAGKIDGACSLVGR